MRRTLVIFMIMFSLILFFLPLVMPGAVFAQTTGYTINQVDHHVQVMYTGQVEVQDTIHVSGQVSSGFMIGLPSKYSNDVLKAVAYDSNNVYQVNLGVQLGQGTGFFGAEVDFDGKSPSDFTVAFVLSNSLLTEVNTGTFTLDYPAYPSLIQNVGSCNVTLTFPTTPKTITIVKSDGNVNGNSYSAQNLAAYTYSTASATVQVTNGTIQLADIKQLNRQITIDPSGTVVAADIYQIVNNSTSTMPFFILDAPTLASNIFVTDETGAVLPITNSSVSDGVIQENATLATALSSGQLTIMTVSYNLPSATIQGSQYTLSDFALFPDFNYFVDYAIFTFNPPEGATIITPQLSSLDSSSSVTRSSFQDTLTITRDDISYVDYGLLNSNALQFSYNYNPVWVSFRPTFWLSLIAAIGCIGTVIYQKRKPGEREPSVSRKAKVSPPKPTPATPTETVKPSEPITVTAPIQRLTGEVVKEFMDSYDEKKRLNTEMKSLDARAQRGKIPRRQYKVQHRAIEIRLESLTRNTNRMKDAFRSAGSSYADLIKQLDSAEEDLNEAENDIKRLEAQQSRGEISIETYKRNIGDYQKRRDKAESTINGILLRLREKTR